MRQARFRAAAGLIAAVALLASCSATKLAYNRIDWVIGWEIGKYVDLDGESKRLFDSGLASLWHWHRNTQLGAYAQDLREVARIAGGPVSADEVRDYLARAREHGRRLFDEAVPRTAPVLAALDDPQVRELLARLAERRKEEAEEDTELTPEEAKRERAKVMARGIDKWFGRVTEEQRALARLWADARREETQLWHAYGEQWGRAFEQTLAVRAQPDFATRLRDVFWEPALPDAAAIKAVREHNRETYVRFVTKLATTLSPDQRRHFQKKVLGLAEDLEALSGKPAAEAETIG